VAIIPRTPGIHHIGLRSTDFDVAKNFYRDSIGFPLIVDRRDLIVFAAGSVFIAFKKAEPRNKNYSFFSPFEVGLDHIAMTCDREEELFRFAKGLVDAGIENTGVKMD